MCDQRLCVCIEQWIEELNLKMSVDCSIVVFCYLYIRIANVALSKHECKHSCHGKEAAPWLANYGQKQHEYQKKWKVSNQVRLTDWKYWLEMGAMKGCEKQREENLRATLNACVAVE